MKKKILIGFFIALILVIYFGCPRKNSKSFSFVYDLLDSMHSLYWGSTYEVLGSDNDAQALTKLINQTNKYKEAAHIMEKYTREKNDYMSTAAKGFVSAALSLVDINDMFVDDIKRTAVSGNKETALAIAERNIQKKKAWEMTDLAATWSMPIVMKYPVKAKNPKGKIPFRISDKEKKMLTSRIDELFGEKLKHYAELAKQGKAGDAGGSVYILEGVRRIREYLIVKTYEEARARRRALPSSL